MNFFYGKGKVTNVAFVGNNGIATIKIHKSIFTRKFRLRTNTLYFLGHQSLLTRPFLNCA